MSTKEWNERFGPPSWPVMMRRHRIPFLTALAFPDLDETTVQNLAGDVDTTKVDICQTPYINFILRWVPQRRLRRARGFGFPNSEMSPVRRDE